ncbi:MAG: CorA-like Mg2+ transporter protein [bacterium ADurb.Bin400]|nr:MAG: CorA-like Mg2+ transporter protein [bacterium ADurb.Bin400]
MEGNNKIERLYLAAWIPRTFLHLGEIYDFLSRTPEIKGLDAKKLVQLRDQLKIDRVTFHRENGFDHLIAICGDIEISVSEDGVIILTTPVTEYQVTLNKLETFYNNNFGPALTYLFSRGAPLPKALSKAHDIYPIFIVANNMTETEAGIFLESASDTLITSQVSDEISFFTGKNITILSLLPAFKDAGITEGELLRNVVFLDEFEKQLSHYLNLHRTMWDQVSKIRESRSMRYKDFPKIREEILDFHRTLSFVKARLAQMEDIVDARAATVNPTVREKLATIGLDRFEYLKADQQYVNHLWQMTIEYVDGTLNLLEYLFQENTQRELSAIKFITFITAITSFFGMNIGFPWEERWPEVADSSYMVLIFMIAFAIGFYYFLKITIYNRRFVVKNSSKFKIKVSEIAELEAPKQTLS